MLIMPSELDLCFSPLNIHVWGANVMHILHRSSEVGEMRSGKRLWLFIRFMEFFQHAVEPSPHRHGCLLEYRLHICPELWSPIKTGGTRSKRPSNVCFWDTQVELFLLQSSDQLSQGERVSSNVPYMVHGRFSGFSWALLTTPLVWECFHDICMTSPKQSSVISTVWRIIKSARRFSVNINQADPSLSDPSSLWLT